MWRSVARATRYTRGGNKKKKMEDPAGRPSPFELVTPLLPGKLTSCSFLTFLVPPLGTLSLPLTVGTPFSPSQFLRAFRPFAASSV